MSNLWGALYAGASGMLANSRSTEIVSTNIANVNTTGYKRSEAAFFDLFTNFNGKQSADVAGGVSTKRLIRVDQQGSVQQTSSITDLAIVGAGFFAVRESEDAGAATLFTRNGSFSEDENGLLRNAAGQILYGWEVDTNGNAIGAGGGVDSLVPIDANLLEDTVLPTSAAEIALNLNASQNSFVPALSGQTLATSTPPTNFSRSITVFDNLGQPQQITLNFAKVLGPSANAVTGNGTPYATSDALVSPTGPTPGIANGDTLVLSGGAAPLTVTFVNAPADTSLNQAATIGDLISVVNNFNDGAVPPQSVYRASLNEEGRVIFQPRNPAATLDLTGSATVFGGTGLNFIPDPVDGDFSYAPEADMNAGTAGANPDQALFPPLANTTSPNPLNWWQLTITTPDPADPVNGTPVAIRQGLLNFDGNGTLNSPLNAQGLPLNGTIDLGLINFNNAPVDRNGAVQPATAEDTAITLDISRISQLSGGYNVIFSEQNGAGIGTRTGIEIQRDGTVVSRFSNGTTAAIYRIPVATFVNSNGLDDLSNTSFMESANSGEVTFSEAGTEGSGILQAASLENSNVDIANEFSILIVNQRGFSLSSQIIQTVDEMTQAVGQLVN